MAPAGTTTVNEVAVAADTVAFTAPKYTMLFPGVALKPVPVIVTVLPMLPDAGAKELMTGWAANCCTNKKTREKRPDIFNARAVLDLDKG